MVRDYEVSSDKELSPENYNNYEEQKTDSRILGYKGDLETQQQLGVELPEEQQKLFRAFNTEIQNSNLPKNVNLAFMSGWEVINRAMDLKHRAEMENYPILSEMFQIDFIDLWNLRLATLTRTFRGIEGFNTRMNRTVLKELRYSQQDAHSKGFGVFSRKRSAE